jgi:crotonobetainyl-CoA:carnitine CoA-transferase CaiB-like acyl-CoA transferase
MTVSLERSPNPAAYAGLRVLEIADTPGAEYTGRLLAEMGAAVLKIEPHGGAASRRIGPFMADGDAAESLHFAFYNGDKHSLVLDLGSSDGKAELSRRLAQTDVLICDLPPATLTALNISHADFSAAHPQLIIAAITPFGLTGPWKDRETSDLVALAGGGPLHMCGYDDHSIPPIRPGGNQAYHIATAFAHIGILLCLLERQRTGRGQIVDLSMHEATAVTVELANPYWFYPKALVQRQTCRHAQPVATQPTLFQCADGYVYFALVLTEEKPWAATLEWLAAHDMVSGLDNPAFLDAGYRQAHFDEIQQVAEVFFLLNGAEQMYREGQARGLPIGKLNAPEDLLHIEHLRARHFFKDVTQHGHTVTYPGPPYRFSAFSAIDPRPAPALNDAAEAAS